MAPGTKKTELSTKQDVSRSARAASFSFALQELWFTLVRRSWTSVALVPAHEGGSVTALAAVLREIGGVFRNSPIALLDGTSLDLEAAAALTLSLRTARSTWVEASQTDRRHTSRALVALGPLLDNPLGIPVALAADGVVLVAQGGITTRHSAQRTLDLVGRENVMGSILLGGD